MRHQQKSVVTALLALTAWFFVAVASALEGADPSVNRPYVRPDVSQWVERFESEGREVYDRRHAIVEASGARPGMVVADIGAGTGLFVREFAARVGPKGRVYAVDIVPEFIDRITREARGPEIAPVVGIINAHDDARLPANAVDIAFLCDTYHHFEQPGPMLASIRRSLRPGGALVVVDFERIEGKSSAWILGHVRAGRDQVIREIESSGFRLERTGNFLRENFLLVFRLNP